MIGTVIGTFGISIQKDASGRLRAVLFELLIDWRFGQPRYCIQDL